MRGAPRRRGWRVVRLCWPGMACRVPRPVEWLAVAWLAACETPETAAQAVDLDHDGVSQLDDCNDTDADMLPGATEVCDGRDNDCDGAIDDDDAEVVDPVEWFIDHDGDGFGVESVRACRRPDGVADRGGDCDDEDGTTFPGAAEVCDGLDNGCDGGVDDACQVAASGELTTTAANSTLYAPFASSQAGMHVYVADFDGDGLDDVGTLALDGESLGLYTARGPLPTKIDLAASDLVVPLSPVDRSEDSVALGADVTGDGVGDWMEVLQVEGGSITAYLFEGPLRAGVAAEEALLTLQADSTFWGVAPQSAWAVLVPGSPGTILLTTQYQRWSESESPSWTVAVSAGLRGVVSSAALQPGAEDTSYTEPYVRFRRAGDVDGDGEQDVVRADAEEIAWYPGPMDSAAGTFIAEVLASERWQRFELGDGQQAADLDGDGAGDLLILAHYADPDDGTAALLRSNLDGGEVSLDEGAPLVIVDSNVEGYANDFAALDANGDGWMDLALSTAADAPHLRSGAVWIAYGPFEAPRRLGEDGAVVRCPDARCEIGYSLGVGDTNGDGLEDLFMGSLLGNNDAEAPVAWALLGGS